MKAKVLVDNQHYQDVATVGDVVEIIPNMEVNAESVYNAPYGMCYLCKTKDNQLFYIPANWLKILCTESTIDWENRRYELSKELMATILKNEDEVNFACQHAEYKKDEKRTIPDAIAQYAIACADALIKRLQMTQK